jgi:hypothetical protein
LGSELEAGSVEQNAHPIDRVPRLPPREACF